MALMIFRASFASTTSSPNVIPPRTVRPPPPKAAAVAIRRAVNALSMGSPTLAVPPCGVDPPDPRVRIRSETGIYPSPQTEILFNDGVDTDRNVLIRGLLTKDFVVDVKDSLIELIGNTPLVRLRRVTQGPGAGGLRPDVRPDGRPDGRPGTGPQVLAKVEYLNPGASVKDRIAVRMIDAAEASGELRPGGTIVEP